ncbi:MAG: CoA-binding protein [Rhodospirillales bacterium]|nr:CoA-binding protein [Rhodospirillales bacterium]
MRWREALFAPTGVALIGASDEPESVRSRPLRFLRQHGFHGRIYSVNPKRTTVGGEKAFPNLDALPEPVDHAYILVGADAAIDAVAACAHHHIPVATVLADGFAEAGAEGERRQQRLLDAARGRTRIVGPNSLGVVDVATGMALTANAAFAIDHLRRGRVAVISQSGSVLGALLSRGESHHLGFSKLISVGNEADLGVGELGLALVEDKATDAILLFLETLRRADDIRRFAHAAFAAGKPVIAYKLGRSEAGRQVSASHTGAMVGSGEAADAFLADCGIVRVDNFEALLEIPPLLKGHRPANRQLRVGVVTTTGGGAAMAVDRMGVLGVTIAPPTRPTLARLAKRGIHVKPGRIADLTLAGARYETVRGALEVLGQAPEFDSVVAVIGSSASLRPDTTVRPIIEAARKHPLAVALIPEAPAALAMLGEAGIAAFRTPEACADALKAFAHWRKPRSIKSVPPNPKAERALKGAPSGWLELGQSLDLVATLGVPVARSVRLLPGDTKPPRLRYPVAVKALSSSVLHKTEASGFILAIASPSALRTATTALLKRLPKAARRDGVLVQEMTRSLCEVLVGYRRDPEVGPVVVLGMGGILAELRHDFAVRPAPIDNATARAMIDEVVGLAIVRGFRARPKGDMTALVSAVVRLSRLAGLAQVAEAEINPLMIRETGVVAVDSRVRLAD